MPDDVRIPFQSVLTVRTPDGQEVPIPAIKGEKGDKGDPGESILIDQHTETGLRFWTGTRAQYEAIPEEQLIPNCMYWITDDTRDDWYTRLETLEETVRNYDSTIAHLETLVETLEPQVEDVQELRTQVETNKTDIVNLKVTTNSLVISLNSKYRPELVYFRKAVFAAWQYGFNVGDYKRIPIHGTQQGAWSPAMFLPGLISDGKRHVYFTVPTPFDLTGLSVATTAAEPVRCNANLRYNGHYINRTDAYVENGQDLSLLGTLSLTICNQHTVVVSLALNNSIPSSLLNNIPNNVPVSVQLNYLSCRFKCNTLPYPTVL